MKSVVLCGSKRFKKEMLAFSQSLLKRGIVVYKPNLHSGHEEWEKLSEYYKDFVALGLTHDHFYKMEKADVVFIFNKDGYIGNSVTLEIGYAVALKKPIYALEPDTVERCRNILFQEIISTPTQLIKRLK